MYLFETTILIDGLEKECLVVFSGQLEGGDLDYAYELEKEFSNIRVKPELVLFIYPKYINNKIDNIFIEDSKSLKNLGRYGSNVPLVFIAFDEFSNFHLDRPIDSIKFPQSLAAIRDEVINGGLSGLLTKRKDQVILKAPSGCIFTKPSGSNYSEFIKTNEMAVGCSENQFVAFSLLSKAPSDKEVKKILIDTSSLSSYIEALLYYLTKFRSTDCKPATYHSFGSYEGKDESKPDDISDVWVIISASKSNNMGKELAAEWGLSNDQVLTVLSYIDAEEENIGDEILFNISNFTESSPIGDDGSLIKVNVLGENFTAEIEKPNEVVIKAKHKVAEITKWIRPNYDKNLFLANRVVEQSGQIKPLYIDFHCGYQFDPNIDGWIKNIIDWYVTPKIKWVVYQESDSDSKNLADNIIAKLNDNGVCKVSKISFSDAEKSIKGNDSLIVAIPVMGTGEILLKLNRNLRISGHTGNRIFISPFVVSESKEKFIKFKNSLLYGPKGLKYLFFSFKEIFIGHKDDNSSWKSELEVVDQLEEDFWKSRSEVLRDTNVGLNGLIGVHANNPKNKLEFTKDFAFWAEGYEPNKVNHEAVYLTISAILQNLRDKPYGTNGEDSLYHHVYQHSVISPENFTRFNDSLLQSCIWRAATNRELDYRSSVDLSGDFLSIQKRLIEDYLVGENNAFLDLLMGLAVKRIQLVPDLLREALVEWMELLKNTGYVISLLKFIENMYFPNNDHTDDLAI